jgi:hypothetical protein
VHVVFGARQTGKSTLLRRLRPDAALWIDLSNPAQRSEHLRRPEALIQRRPCAAVPIEVKWTERPTLADARHLATFLDEHRRSARHGYLNCRCPEPLALDDRIPALPWWSL